MTTLKKTDDNGLSWYSTHQDCFLPRTEQDWPDPDPFRMRTVVDDVSGVNSTEVGAFVQPRNIYDLVAAIKTAHKAKVPVCMRGTQHSMGGQSIAAQGLVLDMRHMKDITRIDPEGMTVTCGPGALWSDLIRALNPYGLSPRTMQSYSSFSVGGTLSVNGHGVTTDDPVAESVLHFDLVMADGTIKEKVSPEDELFGLVLGGYGMFGVISSVTMKIEKNTALSSEMFTCSVKEFPSCYQSFLEEDGDGDDIEVKLCRLDIIHPENIMCYLFRKKPLGIGGNNNSSAPAVVGNLGELETPQEMSDFKRLLYKWLVPPLQEIRYQFEQQSGTALDWGVVGDRNTLMFETAIPLARLSEPLFLAEDTFILQEYFIPQGAFLEWMKAITPILNEVTKKEKGEGEVKEFTEMMSEMVNEVAAGGSNTTTSTTTAGGEADDDADDPAVLQRQMEENISLGHSPASSRNNRQSKIKKEGPQREYRVHLLNVTIRFVKKDKITTLAYSQADSGCFAFVMYFRLQRDEASLARLHAIHQKFLKEALALKGSFYLPYLPHYSPEQVAAAYPRLQSEFVPMKKKYDPELTFQSFWFDRFVAPLLVQHDPSLAAVLDCTRGTEDERASLIDEMQTLLLTDGIDNPSAAAECHPVPIASERRTDSFRALVRTQLLAQRFKQEFLVNVFNVGNANLIMNLMTKLSWDKKSNKDDLSIYIKLLSQFQSSNAGLGKLMVEMKKVRQASHQKKEFVEETKRLLSRIGKLGLVHDYVSIGDHGRMVQAFRNQLGFKGKAWVVHDEASEDANTIALAVERGSSAPVGEEVLIDYSGRCNFSKVPDSCADLVTMNQGLHHLPQDKIPVFLTEVYRVLKPGGLFIVREHDCTPDLTAMCDCAHMVFNAIMGVQITDEMHEIRAFRSVADWRRLITHPKLLNCTPSSSLPADDPQRFFDTCVYDIQSGDPTVDEMLCFYKGPRLFSDADLAALHEHRQRCALDEAQTDAFQQNKLETPVPVLHPAQKELENLPQAVHAAGRGLLKGTAASMDLFVDLIVSFAPEAQREVAKSFLQNTLAPYRTVLTKLFIQAEAVVPRKLHVEPIPVELFHAFRAVQAKIDSNTATPEEVLIVTVIKAVAKAVLDNQQPQQGTPADGEDDFGSAALPQVKQPSEKEVEDEIFSELTILSEEWPEVCGEAYWENTGLPSTLQDTRRLLLRADAKERPQLVRQAASKLVVRLDYQAWEEVRAHLQLMRRTKPPFVLTSALGRGVPKGEDPRQDPWYKLLSLILESRKIQLTYGAIMAAKFVGVGEVEEIWKEAQDYRREKNKKFAASPQGKQLKETDDALTTAVKSFEGPLQIVKFKNQKADQFSDLIEGVVSIESATYEGKDVTAMLINSGIYSAKDQTIRLKNRNLDEVFDYGLTPLSKYFYGARELQITYRSNTTAAVRDTGALQKTAISISTLLHRSGTLRKVSPHSREYNLYKLGEWMQVSICQDFSNSLTVSPWYRYPFTNTMSTYANTCRTLFTRSQSRYGLSASTRALPLLAVPGLVMGAMFGQLQLLAQPVLKSLGSSYKETTMYHRVLVHCPPSEEELRLRRRGQFTDPNSSSFSSPPKPTAEGEEVSNSSIVAPPVDPLDSVQSSQNVVSLARWPNSFMALGVDVHHVSIARGEVSSSSSTGEGNEGPKTKNLFALKMPVFLPFTTALTELAMFADQCTILDISGSNNIHVRLGIDPLKSKKQAAASARFGDAEGAPPKTNSNTGGSEASTVESGPSDAQLYASAEKAMKDFLEKQKPLIEEIVCDTYKMPQPTPRPSSLKPQTLKASVLVPVVRLVEFIRAVKETKAPQVEVEQIFDFQDSSQDPLFGDR